MTYKSLIDSVGTDTEANGINNYDLIVGNFFNSKGIAWP